jgi:hypothetical protein
MAPPIKLRCNLFPRNGSHCLRLREGCQSLLHILAILMRSKEVYVLNRHHCCQLLSVADKDDSLLIVGGAVDDVGELLRGLSRGLGYHGIDLPGGIYGVNDSASSTGVCP